MFCLYHEAEPMVRLYLVDGNHFSTFKVEAKPFATRDEAIEEASKYPFDLQVENIN